MTDPSAVRARRHWAWHVSAAGYRWCYVRVAHRADADVLAFVGDRLTGARVVDCGCGPGVFSEKLARGGARHVLAVDANPSMVRQARVRLSRHLATGAASLRRDVVDQDFFGRVGGDFDLVVFKRSLYASRSRAIATLRAAGTALRPGGMIVLVHPEQSIRRYAFGSPARLRRHTAFHLVNRALSVGADRLGIGEYRTYRRADLLDLLAASVPAGHVEAGATSQAAYNIGAVTIPGQRAGSGASYTR